VAKHSQEEVLTLRDFNLNATQNRVSQFWLGLMKVKDIFYRFCDRILVLGNDTSSCGDVWNQKKPHYERFHRLYDLSFNKDIKVERVIRSFGSCLLFRRTLWGDLTEH
jgi:hypothetical protein